MSRHGDRIVLAGIRGRGFHGVFDHEKRDGQDFVVDVEVEADLARPGRTDDLAHTLDYGAIGTAVVARIEGEAFDLIERLAEVIADDVLALGVAVVERATVTVHKPQAPVPVPFGDVTVQVSRRRPVARVVVAVGANLGDDPAVAVEQGMVEVGTLMEDWTESTLFETDPVGGPPDQPAYVNGVVVGTTRLAPAHLLRRLHEIEARFGRTREVRWGPRTLDLDLIQYGTPGGPDEFTSTAPDLLVPHPRAHERAFVLVPWLDADDGAWVRVGAGLLPVRDLVDTVDAAGVRRRAWPSEEDEE